MSVNTVAATTVVATSAITITAAVTAASVTSTVATVAYTILAVTSLAISIASITAWIDDDSKDVGSYHNNVESYFNTMGSHTKFAIAAVYQFVAQTMVQAVVKGLADGVSTSIRRKISGSDLTFSEEKRSA